MREVLGFTTDPKIVARFKAKVEKRGEDECWEWKAATNQHGYGHFKASKYVLILAHRFAYAFHHSVEPIGLVCHTCDNRLCCNPTHLFLGTSQDNVDDMKSKGRAPNHRGEMNGAAKLTEENVRPIWDLIRSGWSNLAIAQQVAVTDKMISKIRNGHSWTHLRDSAYIEHTRRPYVRKIKLPSKLTA